MYSPSGHPAAAAIEESLLEEHDRVFVPDSGLQQALRVVPVHAIDDDAKGLLKSAIRDENPVVFLEKRLLYGRSGPVPGGEYTVPIGVADVKREGTYVTVVAYAAGVHLAPPGGQADGARRGRGRGGGRAHAEATRPGHDRRVGAEDRTARGRHRGGSAGSFASEVVARVVDECFDALQAPPVRVTAKDTPMPYAAPLERAVLPQVEDVVQGIDQVLGGVQVG